MWPESAAVRRGSAPNPPALLVTQGEEQPRHPHRNQHQEPHWSLTSPRLMAVARRGRGVGRGGLCVAPGLHSPWARGWRGDGDQLGVKKQSQGQRGVKGCAPLISACSQGLCELPKRQV